jgi:hypothetical protein
MFNNNDFGPVRDKSTYMPGDAWTFNEWKDENTGARYVEHAPSDLIDLHIGLDIGYKHDRSCACVIEVMLGPKSEQIFVVRYLKRWKQGLLYPSLVKQVERLYNHLKASGHGKPVSTYFAVDSTGVGEGVAQLIDNALPSESVFHYYITSGINQNIDSFGHHHIPKGQMISGIVGAISSGALRLPRDISQTKDGEEMLKEMFEYEIKIADNGHDTYGSGQKFDDMVCSLGLSLACAVEYGSHTDDGIW